MHLDFNTLTLLRQNHPAWRLLRSDHAPMVASFLHNVFIKQNVRSISQADTVELLEDQLFELRKHSEEDAFPRSAQEYLNDWSGSDKGWLRKFYPPNSDEPHFDLTPSTEKALQWLAMLGERTFVGTESRVRTLIELLRQIAEGTESDPAVRVAELQKRREAIDAEIARILAGHIPLLDDTAIKDRFQQFIQLARELLSDFRQVEQNFRVLDRQVREKIALWEGSKGTLLEEIMGERDAIEDSEQGRSFRSFWSYLMSQQRQEELTRLLEHVLHLQPVEDMKPEPRLRRVHYDWLEAGEHTQRMVAQLSQQLRRFLDDKAWLENRRIMDLLHSIETSTLAVRQAPPTGAFTTIADTAAEIALPMERPLFTPPNKPNIVDMVLENGDGLVDLSSLFSQVIVDIRKLASNVRQALQERSQITLGDLLIIYPLEYGLAELVAYLQLASESSHAVVDKNESEVVEWTGKDGIRRRGRLPKIIFVGY